MAKKLGKKARKFARKNLQAVAKRQRKQRALFKRRYAPRKGGNREESHDGGDGDEKMVQVQPGNGRVEDSTKNTKEFIDPFSNYLENLFPEGDGLDEDLSDSNGYLSEDPECPYYSEDEDENENGVKVHNAKATLQGQNSEISSEIAKQKKKLDKLQKKDPEFASFLERRQSDLVQYGRNEYSDEDEVESADEDDISGGNSYSNDKVLTGKTIDVWCQLVVKEPDGPVLRNILNAFRVACRYGAGSDNATSKRLQSSEVFSRTLTFVLSESDSIFRRLLGISHDANNEKILSLKEKEKWRTARSLIKSYLLSSLDLLNQLTDNQILVLVLSRIRASVVFFVAFPSLARRLIKVSVHLWATGDQRLSSESFLIIREIALLLPSDCLDICLTRTYNTFIASCKLVEDANLKHIEFLMNCVAELHSLDIQKSCERAVLSLGQLTTILRQASKSKQKEELRKIHSWQYINCLSLWVRFICCNYQDYDLQPLVSSVIQIIRGVAHLFTGPRYLPLRLKCVRMLNELSICSRLFLPVASLVFDCLEYREISNSGQEQRITVKFSSLLKVPKSLLKSRSFQEECVLSAIELLSAHFAQWSYHISFPEIATIPLILLKRLHDKTTIESLRRPVKRLIDQVNENSDFILKKREEVSFSPNDQVSVESFLQLEKSSTNASFTKFYASVLKNSHARNMVE